MNEKVIFEHVSKKFKEKKVLSNVSFQIKKGDIVGVLGRSGSGKSILLDLITELITPSSGTVISNGKIGFSTQANSIYGELTVNQNFNYFSKLYGVKEFKKRTTQLAELLGLSPYLKTPVKKLSGGQKKRVDIICALLDSPDILVLDEPFAGLDSFLVNTLTRFLKSIQEKETTIIFSSHLVHQIDILCTRVFFIENEVVKEITKAQLKSLYGIAIK